MRRSHAEMTAEERAKLSRPWTGWGSSANDGTTLEGALGRKGRDSEDLAREIVKKEALAALSISG